MSTSTRRYLKEFGLAIVAYMVAILVSVTLLKQIDDPVIAIPLALLPMVPAWFVLTAVVRYTRQLDELQRQVQFEGLAFAFGGTAMVTFSYGLLENAGFPSLTGRGSGQSWRSCGGSASRWRTGES